MLQIPSAGTPEPARPITSWQALRHFTAQLLCGALLLQLSPPALGVPLRAAEAEQQDGVDAQRFQRSPPRLPSTGTAETVVATPTPAKAGDLPLQTEFNLVSLPVEPTSTAPADVLAGAPAGTSAWTWDACEAEAAWRQYTPGDPANELTSIDHLYGLWIKAPAAGGWTLPAGEQPTVTEIPVCPGWNLIGYPLAQPRPVPAALASIAGKYLRVFGYDAFDEKDPWEVYDPNVPDWANDLRELQPGRGYWVLVTEATTVRFANHGPPPQVALTSPLDLDEITSPVEVTAQIESDLLQSWQLSYRPAGLDDASSGNTAEWLPLAEGQTPTSGTLATFDPTLLPNDLYQLRLTATDFAEQSSEQVVSVAVDGGMKIGHVQLAYSDLLVPLSGFDLEVVRSYDSRDKQVRDFGAGWSLEVRKGSVRHNRLPGQGWRIAASEGPLGLPCQVVEETLSHLTLVRLSDRETYRFRLQLDQPQSLAGGCAARASFAFVDGPLPGARLELLGNDQVLWENGANSVKDLDTLEIFRPERVRLHTRDGDAFVLGLETGVEEARDLNGNSLTITADGVEHSSGVSIRFERDSEGRIVRILDPAGNANTYEYSPQGDLMQHRSRLDETTGYRYAPDHYLTTIVDPQGREIAALGYTPDGRLERSCDALGNCSSLVHDLPGRREILTDATDRRTEVQYDERGNVLAVVEGLGNTTLFTYNDWDQRTSMVNPLGHETRWSYDARGNLTSRVDPHLPDQAAADFTTRFTFDERDRPLAVIAPDGTERHFEYSDANQQLAIRDEAGRLLHGWEYDAQGNVTAELDGFGTTRYYDLTAAGEPRRIVDAEGTELRADYDAQGNLTELRHRDRVSRHQYDAEGREVRTDYEDGSWAAQTYGQDGFWQTSTTSLVGEVGRSVDANGCLAGWTQDGTSTLTYTRDAAGRTTAQTDSVGDTTRYGHDAAGRVTRVEFPGHGAMDFDLDAAGQVTTATDALGNRESFTYTPSGATATRRNARGFTWSFDHGASFFQETDPLGRSLRTEYGAEGVIVRQVLRDGEARTWTYLDGVPPGEHRDYPTSFTDEGGHVREFVYDAGGVLTSAQDAGGHTWTYTDEQTANGLQDQTSVQAPTGEVLRREVYDSLGQRRSLDFGDGGVFRFDYEDGPDPTRVRLPSSSEILYSYDRGRVSQRTLSTPGGTSTSAVFAWDAASRLTQASNAVTTTSYTYAPGSLLQGLQRADGSAVTCEHDALGRVSAVTVTPPGGGAGAVTRYTRDAVGNVTAIDDPLGGRTMFTYDAVNRPTQRELPNGVVTTWQYDLRDHVAAIEHRAADGTVLQSFAYQRGPQGEPLRVEREDGSVVEYAYESAFRIASERHLSPEGTVVHEVSYTFDAAGNRTQRVIDGVTQSSTYLSGTRLASLKEDGTVVEAYSWDADGRVRQVERSGETWSYEHDAIDRLVSATSTSGTTLTHRYDAEGRRIGTVEGSEERSFVVAPSLGTGLDTVHYAASDTGSWTVYVHAVGGPLLRYGDIGAVYYLEDGQGSVRGLLSGEGLETVDYDAFGAPLGAAATPEAAGGDFAFQSGWWEPTSALYQLGARWYDPQTGRFLSRDAAELDPYEPESVHPYVFAYNNPLVFGDPTGLFTIVDINISLSVQNIVGAAKTYAAKELRDRAIEKLGEVLTSVLKDFLFSFLGFELDAFGFAQNVGSKAGAMFEDFTAHTLCFLFRDTNPEVMWFEPGLRQRTGEAESDGYTCQERPRSVGRTREVRYPDIMVRDRPPTFRPRKTFLTGEIKLGINSFYNAWRRRQRGQWNAIWRHANNYSFPPHLVFLVSFKGGKRYHWNWLEREVRSKGVAGLILSIAGKRS